MRFPSALGVLAVALAIGCGGRPAYVVVAQARPDPFVRAPRFAVAAVDFTGVTVRGEPEERWAARQGPEKLNGFERDKDAIHASFTKALVERAHERGFDVVPASTPDAAPFVVRAVVRDVEPGLVSLTGADTTPSRIRMRVMIGRADGRRLDEIVVEHAGGGGVASTGQQHLGADAAALGEATADYLAGRIGGRD